MNRLKTLHRQAMEQTDFALSARKKGNEGDALLHFRNAYELEAEAANILVNNFDAEPTRSVLFRSAATLAMDCHLNREAEKLVCAALMGRPPEEIAEELRDLIEQIHFQRHLELRGIELHPDEIQMSIGGKSIGYGIAPTETFLERVENTENLLYRTAERQQNRPYRDRGRKDRSLKETFQLYMTVPRAASFAVTFKVGGSNQLSLPGLSMGEEVIDELLSCLELYTSGDEDQLKERIKDEAYYRNFVSLAHSIEPDGKKVDIVGFTIVRHGTAKKIAMTQSKKDTLALLNELESKRDKKKRNNHEPVEVSGILKVANSKKKDAEIEIISPGNATHIVVVPPGMMSDIVKPLWDSEVVVTGIQKGKKIHLIQIRAVDV